MLNTSFQRENHKVSFMDSGEILLKHVKNLCKRTLHRLKSLKQYFILVFDGVVGVGVIYTQFDKILICTSNTKFYAN